MKLLLDTHVLVWFAEGLDELGEEARSAIEREARGAGLGVSAISFWEVAMLAQRGRIALTAPLLHWRARINAAPGFVEAALGGDVAIEAVQLPGKLHGDPADRLLVATARLQGWRLATRDRRLLDYGDQGHVAVLAV